MEGSRNERSCSESGKSSGEMVCKTTYRSERTSRWGWVSVNGILQKYNEGVLHHRDAHNIKKQYFSTEVNVTKCNKYVKTTHCHLMDTANFCLLR